MTLAGTYDFQHKIIVDKFQARLGQQVLLAWRGAIQLANYHPRNTYRTCMHYR